MKKLPKCFFPLLTAYCLLLSSIALAQTPGLTINGDNVSYDQANHLVEGTGSVEVAYQDTLIHSQHIIYNTQIDLLKADGGFNLSYDSISLEGATLNYNLSSREGDATKINFDYQGINISGDNLKIGPEQFELKNASFTTCNLTQPHYHVTARDITLYPEHGWLVASWGWFWLGRFPLVPVPTYIFDLHADPAKRKKQLPFPDIGSNDEDGFYVNETLAWHIRRELSGSYTLSYAGKKGAGGGVEADYIINDDSKGNARFYGNAGDGYWGGLTHRLYFGEEIAAETTIPLTFFALPKYRQRELEITVSSRERINYQRVSYLPKLLLKTKEGKLFWPELKYDLELGAASVIEENNLSLREGIDKATAYWDFPETPYGDITPTLPLEGLFYSNGQRWLKLAVGLDYKQKFANQVSLGLGYLHYFKISGQSPFNFEMYRFRPADKLSGDLFFLLQETGVGIHTSYFLDNWDPEDIDYTLMFRMHCYNLSLQYRSLRGEFAVGFDLMEVK